MQSMQYLTPSELISKAPAARRFRTKDPSLLDTAAFLRHIEEDRGFQPVLAVQGTAHDDGRSGPGKGRHLVVAADRRGSALVLLNSHTVHRKAWMGAGFVAILNQQPLFIAGAVIPVARWRGFADPLAELDKWEPVLRDIRKGLDGWRLNADEVRAFAADFASAAYLQDHKKAAPEAFVDIAPKNAYEMTFLMLRRAMDGNLQPADPNARKLKPVKGPDAIMHAANAAFRVAASLAMVHGRISAPPPLPRFQYS